MKEYIAEYIVQVEKKGKNCMFDFVNAKRLIRCKDCKYYDDKHEVCCVYSSYRLPKNEDDFCSKAESKEK